MYHLGFELATRIPLKHRSIHELKENVEKLRNRCRNNPPVGIFAAAAGAGAGAIGYYQRRSFYDIVKKSYFVRCSM